MTHPEIIEQRGVRYLKCPTRGCEEPLNRKPSVRIRDDGEIRIVWRCAHCDKPTELVADISDSCWTYDETLIPTPPDSPLPEGSDGEHS